MTKNTKQNKTKKKTFPVFNTLNMTETLNQIWALESGHHGNTKLSSHLGLPPPLRVSLTLRDSQHNEINLSSHRIGFSTSCSFSWPSQLHSLCLQVDEHIRQGKHRVQGKQNGRKGHKSYQTTQQTRPAVFVSFGNSVKNKTKKNPRSIYK